MNRFLVFIMILTIIVLLGYFYMLLELLSNGMDIVTTIFQLSQTASFIIALLTLFYVIAMFKQIEEMQKQRELQSQPLLTLKKIILLPEIVISQDSTILNMIYKFEGNVENIGDVTAVGIVLVINAKKITKDIVSEPIVYPIRFIKSNQSSIISNQILSGSIENLLKPFINIEEPFHLFLEIYYKNPIGGYFKTSEEYLPFLNKENHSTIKEVYNKISKYQSEGYKDIQYEHHIISGILIKKETEGRFPILELGYIQNKFNFQIITKKEYETGISPYKEKINNKTVVLEL